MKTITVTTSWDDGHKHDLKLAELLSKYGVAGTFYISPKNHEISAANRLSRSEIIRLSRHFEIGAHTMTHQDLTKLSLTQAAAEISASQKYLEKLIGKTVTSFCYPYGTYNLPLRGVVRSEGFEYARTTKNESVDHMAKGVLEAAVSVHAYRRWKNVWRVARFAKFHPQRSVNYLLNWDQLAIACFEESVEKGNAFHLWGHSWEVDKYDDWDRLERVLKHISSRKNIRFVNNAVLGKPAKPKLIIAASYFPPMVGGLERYAWEMAKAAHAAGYEVVVVCSGSGKRINQEFKEGLKIYRLPTQFKISNSPVNIRWYWMIKKILADENPDIVNVHMPVPYLADLLILAAKGIPKVVTYHSGSMKKRSLFLDRIIDAYECFLLPLTLKRADEIVASSDFTKNDFLKKYRAKTITIEPGVDTSLFKLRAKAPNSNKVLFIGNFSYQWKGLDYLKAAIKRLPDLELTVVGRGPHAAATRTTYKGVLHGNELVKQIQLSKMMVLPSISNSESFGMVLLEAMACGVPVIGSNIGGIPHVIKHDYNGLLVEPRDVDGLVAAISELAGNRSLEKKLVKTAYRDVKNNRTWEKQAQKYLNLLSGLMDGPTLGGRNGKSVKDPQEKA